MKPSVRGLPLKQMRHLEAKLLTTYSTCLLLYRLGIPIADSELSSALTEIALQFTLQPLDLYTPLSEVNQANLAWSV